MFLTANHRPHGTATALNRDLEKLLAENKALRIQLYELQIALRRARETGELITPHSMHLVAANG